MAATGQAPGAEGQVTGQASRYLADAQTARQALGELQGQRLTSPDGQPVITHGAPLTYCGGTPAQRDDHDLYAVRAAPYDARISGNGQATDVAPQQERMLRAQRDERRLDTLRATNGAALPDYPVETLVLGGGVQAAKAVGKRRLKRLGRWRWLVGRRERRLLHQPQMSL